MRDIANLKGFFYESDFTVDFTIDTNVTVDIIEIIDTDTYDLRDYVHPSWPSDAAAVNYQRLQDTLARLNKEYEVSVAGGKVSLSGMLYDYGIYKENEKLPATKEELEAATEKISAIIGAVESTQDLKMTDIQKFTNARNEAYDLAVSVNNAKVESLKTLIAMIGDH